VEHDVGFDVPLERSSFCGLDASGRIVREAKIASEPEAPVACCHDLGLAVTRVGLEAGPLSPSGACWRPPLRGRIDAAGIDGSMPG
jgi:transposase